MLSTIARLLGLHRSQNGTAATEVAIAVTETEAKLADISEQAIASEAQAKVPHDPIQRVYELSSQRDWPALQACGLEFLAEVRAGEVLAQIAHGLQEQGRFQEAAYFAYVAADIAPHLWQAQFLAGVAFKEMGRFGEACRHLRMALEVAPKEQQTLSHFVAAVAKAEGLTEAENQYRAQCARAGLAADILLAPIRGVREWAVEAGAPLLEAGDVEEIPFKPPVVWGEPISEPTVSALSNKPYVAELSNVRIFGGSGIIVTADGVALSDVGADPLFGSHVQFAYERIVLARDPGRLLLGLGSYETREIEGGVWMAGLATWAFGHWLPDFLPKLQFLKQHPAFAQQPLIVDADMPQPHFDHLRRLVENPLLLLKSDESFTCRRLLVASSPAFFPVDILPQEIPVSKMPGLSPRALRFLRAEDGPDGSGPGQRRILLARRKRFGRRLQNEAQIATALAAHGFETVYLEEMTAHEQIALFRDAGWIVGPNGSALLNVIFADPGVKLLILSQPDFFNWGTYQGPMESLGYQPRWVCGDRPSGPVGKHSDYEVPLTRIMDALREMGLPEAAPKRIGEGRQA